MKHLLLLLLGLLLAGPAVANDTVYYYSSDALHSEVVITDAHRNVVERTYYAPYGQVLNRALRDGPGYTGHEEDPETSLVYMQQRYYDPESGRFLSIDPVVTTGDGDNFNHYWYANDNPYRYTDPDGRESGDLSLRIAEYSEGNLQSFDTYHNFDQEKAWQDIQWVPGVTLIGCFANGCDTHDWVQSVAYVILAPGKDGDEGAFFPESFTPVVKDFSRLRNGHLAGSVHPKTGIPFKANGHPDFTGVAKTEVKIKQTGTRSGDFRAANEAAGLKNTPEGYSWHHHEDGTTMQLVPRDIHSQTGHTGGYRPKCANDGCD